jgi:GxxExxY protein
MTLIKSKLIYPELSYKINGVLFEVHNKLGRFCKEKQYQDYIAEILSKREIEFEREKPINISDEVGGNRADFIIENKIILECKAKPVVTKDDYYQVLRYLKASGKKLGLLVNFRNTYLRSKRIAN